MDNQPGKLIIDSEVALDIKDATGLFALTVGKGELARTAFCHGGSRAGIKSRLSR